MTWLARLREAGENATPKPWYKVVNDLIGGWSASTVNQPASEGSVPTPADFLSAEDAAFIVLARNVWPLVVDALEAAEVALWAQCPACLVERADYEGPDGAWLPECPNCGSHGNPEVVPHALRAALAVLRAAVEEK